MTLPPELTETVHECLDMFITRSMHDWSRYVRTSELSMPLFGILMHLHYRNSTNISHLSQYLGISAPAASQLVDRLVKGGLVERTEEPQNRRAKHLSLTRKGRELIETGLSHRHLWVGPVLERLSPQESRTVRQGLEILARNLRQMQDEKEVQSPS
jgi:DNA-binding MarR family transcriptional regulator